MQQHLGDVDLDRADLVARPTQGRCIGQAFGLLHSHQLRRENGTNGAGIDRAIGVPTSASIDRADIEAGAATNAVQRLTSYIVSKNIGAPVIQQDQVEGLRTISLRYPCPQAGVGVHSFAGRTARQELQEDGEVLKRGQNFLDTHHGDEGPGQCQAHAPIAFALRHADRPGLGNGEVRTAHGHLGSEELLA